MCVCVVNATQCSYHFLRRVLSMHIRSNNSKLICTIWDPMTQRGSIKKSRITLEPNFFERAHWGFKGLTKKRWSYIEDRTIGWKPLNWITSTGFNYTQKILNCLQERKLLPVAHRKINFSNISPVLNLLTNKKNSQPTFFVIFFK